MVAVAALLFAAPSAQAAFHLMKVVEVFPGTNLAPDKAFIELQMYEPGQNLVNGHSVTVYNASGTVTATVPMNASVPNGESQRTILLGDIDVTNRDFPANVGTLIVRTGGAVCFADAQPPDCVAWGNFSAPGALPGAVGTPVLPGGIPNESSIVRSITPNCPTLLEAADDTDDSATDWLETTTESPRSNLDPVTEVACGSLDPPQTSIDKAPKKTLKKNKAKITFSADDPAATFECKLDKEDFESCDSPTTYKKLKNGKHKVQVQATGSNGLTDPSPAKANFKVKVKK